MSERIRIVLADDHPPTLERVQQLLSERFDVVDAVNDGPALLEAAARLNPDLVIVDIAMPGMSGLDVTSELKRRQCPASILILTVSDDPDIAQEAFALGASGYVVKTFMATELIVAVDAIMKGTTFRSAGLGPAT